MFSTPLPSFYSHLGSVHFIELILIKAVSEISYILDIRRYNKELWHRLHSRWKCSAGTRNEDGEPAPDKTKLICDNEVCLFI